MKINEIPRENHYFLESRECRGRPKSSQNRPRTSQDGPKSSQDVSRRPQDAPRRPRDASKGARAPEKSPRDAPRRLYGRPESPKNAPGRPRDASKDARAPKKSPRDGPRTPPRASGEPPNRPRTPPRRLQGRPGSPKSPPNRSRMYQGGPKIALAPAARADLEWMWGRFCVDVGFVWTRFRPVFCLYSFLLECFKSNAFEQIPQTSLAIGGSYLSCRELPLFSRIFPRRQPTCLDLPRLA